MRCARCEFENIPGQVRCIRCGSILEAGSDTIQIHPPRMPAWRKPFRDVTRWLRGCCIIPEESPISRVRRRLDPILSEGTVGLVLSVVPGLAHLLKGRFAEVRLFVALWFVLLCVGLFLYHSTIGLLLIGLAIGIHAWIAVQYGLFKEIPRFLERVGAVLIVVVLLAVLYWATPRVAAPGLTGGPTALTIPALNVHPGDYFLVRRLARADDQLRRGALVLIFPPSLQNAHRGRFVNQGQLMIGQIAGLPGETIQVESNAYMVGTQRLDPNSLPVPGWLQPRPPHSGIYVPAHSYFVSSEYVVEGHGNVVVTDQMISNVCIFDASDIRGRAFLHWWPLRRRKFIE